MIADALGGAGNADGAVVWLVGGMENSIILKRRSVGLEKQMSGVGSVIPSYTYI